MGRLVAGGDHAGSRRAGCDRAATQVRHRAAGRQADGDARREVDVVGKLAVGEVRRAATGGDPRQGQRGGRDARLEGRSEFGIGEQRQRRKAGQRRPLIEGDVDQRESPLGVSRASPAAV